MIIKISQKKFIFINREKGHIIPRLVQLSANKYIPRYIGLIKQIKLPLDDSTSLIIDEATVTAFHNYEGSTRAFIIESSSTEYSHTVILVKVPETPFWKFYYFIDTRLDSRGYVTSEDLKSSGLPLHLQTAEEIKEGVRI